MARIRSLKPETAADEKLASYPIEVRYTFLLVVSRADDYGLLQAQPRQLVGELYPHNPEVTESHLEGWLNTLVRGKQLRWRRTTDGARVIEVVNWKRHQKVPRPGNPALRDRLLPIDWDDPQAPPQQEVRAVARTFPVADTKKLCAEREREVGSGKTSSAASPQGVSTKDAVLSPGFTASAVQAYQATAGGIHAGRILRILKLLVGAHGEADVLTRWIDFCKAGRNFDWEGEAWVKKPLSTTALTPERFRDTYAKWGPQ